MMNQRLHLERAVLLRVAVVAGSVVAAVLLAIAISRPYISGDTVSLAGGAAQLRLCISEGRVGNCPEIQHFALLQYLPALLFEGIGLDIDATVRALSVLSAVSVIGAVGLLVWVLGSQGYGAWRVGLVVLLGSPFLWYATASFGEALQSFVILAFVAAVVRGAPPWVIVLVTTAAGLSKETALPFLVLLGVSACLVRAGTAWRRDLRRIALPAVAGIVASVLLAGALNLVRYGTWANVYTLDWQFRTPGWPLRANFFGGLWLSPNGGLLSIWPALLFVGALTLLCALLVARSQPRRSVAFGLALAIALGSAGGLAIWAFPFGWVAWGPRLLLPLLPALLLILLLGTDSRVRRWLSAPVSRAVLALLAGWGFIVSWGATVDATGLLGRFFAPVGPCEGAVIQSSPGTYFACMRHLIWDPSRLLPEASEAALRFPAVVVSLVGVVAIVALAASIGSPGNRNC